MLRRLDHLLGAGELAAADRHDQLLTGRYYLSCAERRVRNALDDLWSNDDSQTTQVADALLGRNR